MLALVLPGLAYFVVFFYAPIAGYVIAFQDYLPFQGFSGAQWVGWANFAALFQDRAFWAAVRNTVVITVLQLVFFFPAPIALALVLHGILSPGIRKFVQSVVYLPHFISWVIVVAIWQQVLGGAGDLSHVVQAAGLPAPGVLTSPELFKWLVVAQIIWKETGWGTIIYLAALASIDIGLYEAAAIDGAGRFRRLVHVTLPGILDVTVVLLILRLGQVLSVGFEQILLQRNAVGPEAGEVLDTYVYLNGVVGGQWGVSAAAGLIKGILGTAIVIAANKVAHRLGSGGVYSS